MQGDVNLSPVPASFEPSGAGDVISCCDEFTNGVLSVQEKPGSPFLDGVRREVGRRPPESPDGEESPSLAPSTGAEPPRSGAPVEGTVEACDATPSAVESTSIVLTDNNGQPLEDLGPIVGESPTSSEALCRHLRCQCKGLCLHYRRKRPASGSPWGCDCDLHGKRPRPYCDPPAPVTPISDAEADAALGPDSPREFAFALAVLASLEARSHFASRAHLWCFLRFFGIAAEHDHALTAFSQSHGGAPYAVALVSPPDAHRTERHLVFRTDPEELRGYNEHLHNALVDGGPFLHFVEGPGGVAYDGVYRLTNDWQSLRLDRRREWWWRAERSGTPPP
eukprot:EG_transcript_19296